MGGSDQLEHIRKLYCWRIVAEKVVIQWLLFIARLIIAHIEHQDMLVCIRTNSKKLLHVCNSYKNSKMEVKTMVRTNVRNNILNALYGRFGSGGTSIIPTSGGFYLGFSAAEG